MWINKVFGIQMARSRWFDLLFIDYKNELVQKRLSYKKQVSAASYRLDKPLVVGEFAFVCAEKETIQQLYQYAYNNGYAVYILILKNITWINKYILKNQIRALGPGNTTKKAIATIFDRHKITEWEPSKAKTEQVDSSISQSDFKSLNAYWCTIVNYS